MNRKVLKRSRLFASVDWQADNQINWYLRRRLTKDVIICVQILRVIARWQATERHSVRGACHWVQTHWTTFAPLQGCAQAGPEGGWHCASRLRSTGSGPQWLAIHHHVSHQDSRAEKRGAVGRQESSQAPESRGQPIPLGRQRLRMQQLQQDLPLEDRSLQPQPALQLHHRLTMGATPLSPETEGRQHDHRSESFIHFTYFEAISSGKIKKNRGGGLSLPGKKPKQKAVCFF